MYRIRLASGAETDYQSIDELSAALQGGIVTAEALIYHQRADRWLSITNHPHYQIALSRGTPPAAKPDGSKRQVISAIRPDGQTPAPHAAPGSQSAPETKAPRRLTIPAPRKAEPASLLAYENVLEGVVVTKPEQGESGNGHTDLAEKTAALPIRSTPVSRPPVAPLPKLPDVSARLELVESIAPEPVTAGRSSTATPQVDKLLEMLEPSVKPAVAPTLSPVEKAEALLRDPAAAKVPPLFPAVDDKVVASLQTELAAAAVYRPRKQNTKVMGIGAGALLVIVVGLLVWKPWAGSAPVEEGTTIASTSLPRTEAFGGSSADPAAPDGNDVPAAVTSDSAKASSKRVDSTPAIVRVSAPRNLNVRVPKGNLIETGNTSELSITAGTLIRNFNAAYTEARSELELRMLQIGFTQIFLRSRLATSSGVEDTRRLIASASSALRQYRGQESQIQRAYQDTVGVAGRNLGWTPRDLGTWNAKPEQKENAETLRLTNLILSQMDSVFNLLAEYEGKYQLAGETITFEDAEVGRAYGALRAWLNQQADKYSGSSDALPATLRQVVKAIGATRLPMERKN